MLAGCSVDQVVNEFVDVYVFVGCTVVAVAGCTTVDVCGLYGCKLVCSCGLYGGRLVVGSTVADSCKVACVVVGCTHVIMDLWALHWLHLRLWW